MYDKYNILCCLFASGYKKGYNMNMKIENVIKELSFKYNKKEKVIELMFTEATAAGYNMQEFEMIIDEFYSKKINL